MDFLNTIWSISNKCCEFVSNIDELLCKKDTTREPRDNKQGYVYFIYAPALYKTGVHHIKIGRTNNLTKRLKQLQTGCSFTLEIYKSINTNQASKLEATLHRKYKNKQILNEWYNLTLDEVDTIYEDSAIDDFVYI